MVGADNGGGLVPCLCGFPVASGVNSVNRDIAGLLFASKFKLGETRFDTNKALENNSCC